SFAESDARYPLPPSLVPPGRGLVHAHNVTRLPSGSQGACFTPEEHVPQRGKGRGTPLTAAAGPFVPVMLDGDANVLHLRKDVQAVLPAFSADAAVLHAAERRPQIPDEKVVDPQGAHQNLGRHPMGPPGVPGLEDAA